MTDSPWQPAPLPAPADMYTGLLVAVLVVTLAAHTLHTLTGRTGIALLTATGPDRRTALTRVAILAPVNILVAALTWPWVWTRPSDAWIRLPMMDTRDLYYALNWLIGVLLWASLAATTVGLVVVTLVALLCPSKKPGENSGNADLNQPVNDPPSRPDRYGGDLSNEEYLALQGFLYSGGGQGWLLRAGTSSIMGWHWKDDNDANWNTADTALEGFFHTRSSREAALNCGWRVVPDHTDSGRLREFLAAELHRENAKQIKHTTVDLDDLPEDAPLTPEESEFFSQLYPDNHYRPDSLQHT
ncbi:hypothetical protein [Mycobacteroides franklinii]|uniref:Uncharacterized protein n=1 Tax=Mycobacteroides franklinii TaxID=948102 RepID=A0A4R5PDZ2_9MYCO|nr:hypothetical protein [Mycobacteroides franklinii]TDH23178.1 hypothetical protein EJ571_06895 [Mycobacteroides franklinii]